MGNGRSGSSGLGNRYVFSKYSLTHARGGMDSNAPKLVSGVLHDASG